MNLWAMLRKIGKKPFLPLWRRVWLRIETKLKPIEAIVGDHSHQLAAAESRLSYLPVLDQRLHAAELKSNHVPVLERRLAAAESQIDSLPLLDRRLRAAEQQANHVPVLDRRLGAAEQQANHVPVLDQRLCAAEQQANHVPVLDRRLAILENGWRQHVPSLLNAVSTVAAFGYELASLQREIENGASELRESVAILRRDGEVLADKVQKCLVGPRHNMESVAGETRQESAGLRQSAEAVVNDSREGIVALRRDAEALARETRESLAALRQEARRITIETINRGFPERINGEIGSLWKAAGDVNKNIGDLWHRVEFVRREIMYEIKYGIQNSSRDSGQVARILSPEKIIAAKSGGVKLNLGCGHVPIDDYINVDQRELPGVDIISDAGSLPFEKHSLREIFSAHVLEHFPQEHLRRLLPYWRSLLMPDGLFRAIVPDGETMLAGIAGGSYPFEEFREVLFGAQEYEGDFHFNLLTPDSLTRLLTEAGFKKVEVPVKGRRNGNCFEFEIRAQQ